MNLHWFFRKVLWCQKPNPSIRPAAPLVQLDATPPHRRLPRWLKRSVPLGNSNHFTSNLLEELKLETVCENAKCPNRMECYSHKTATFMILGNVCTRPCGFCAVERGRPEPLEPDEPERLAEAAERLGLAHVVITSVTRDDLADGGADHYVSVHQCRPRENRCHGRSPDTRLYHEKAALDDVIERRPMCSITTPKRFPVCIGVSRPQIRLPLDARLAARSRNGIRRS